MSWGDWFGLIWIVAVAAYIWLIGYQFGHDRGVDSVLKTLCASTTPKEEK